MNAVMPTAVARRRLFYATILASCVLLVLFGFYWRVPVEALTTFGLSQNNDIANWLLPTRPTLLICALGLSILLGLLFAPFAQRWLLPLLAVGLLGFMFAFLVWATAGKSLNLIGLLATTLVKAVPLTLGALAGIVCERAGVVNIAIEGLMLTAALVAAAVASLTKGWGGALLGIPLNLWVGLLSAILTGVALASVHALLSVRYKIDQIISGTVINIFAVGITSYLSSKFLQVHQELNSPGVFPTQPLPLLAQIPIIGPLLFNHNLFIYLMFSGIVILQVGLFATRWGLRLRAVGEHPKAADTLGVPVSATRYQAVLLSGLLAGIAGAYFTLGSVGRFDEMMTAGRCFISLAAMIFGNWLPWGAFVASLLFGFTDSLASKLAILKLPIPSEFLLMAPYLASIVVLAGLVGRSHAPAAVGKPYDK